MQSPANMSKKSLLGCLLVTFSLSSSAAVLFSDDFETGDFSHTLNGAQWGSREQVTVSSTMAHAGKYSAKFHYTGNTDLSADAWSELRFDLGKTYTELWIQYDLYVPANYQHRTPSGPANDKFLRLWGATYDDQDKVGFSTFPNNGYSTLQGEWYDNSLSVSTGAGFNNWQKSASSGITADDLGKWVTFRIYVKAATSSSYGTMKVWKNNVLIIDDSNVLNNYWSSSSATHAYRYGYFLGWSNSGYNQDTDFYFDDLVIGTQESDLGAVVSPPQPPTLNIN